MPSVRASVLLSSLIALASLSACAEFPELEVSEAEFDDKTPYPEFVPLEVLLKEPEATITDEVQDTLTSRREELQSTPASDTTSSDPVLDRIDALRAQQSTQTNGDPIIDDELRKRMEAGIKAPIHRLKTWHRPNKSPCFVNSHQTNIARTCTGD